MRNKKKIYTVWDDDLVLVIKKYNKDIENVKESKYICSRCHQEMNYDEIASILISNGKLNLFCSKCTSGVGR